MSLDLSPAWISLRTAIAATAIALWLGIAAARWMHSYQGRGKGLIDGLFTLPLVLPPTVLGFLLLLLLGKHGPLGQLLRQLGINVIFAWPATVIAAAVAAFPLVYKTVLGAFAQIETDLLSCARTLGASEWRIFWLILLPLAWPGVVAGAILAFARALGEFGATLMVAGSIPGITQTIPIAIFFAAEAGKMGEALIWVLVMVAIALSVIAKINGWSQAQHPLTVGRRTNTLTKRLLNFLILGQWQDIALAEEHFSHRNTTRLGSDRPRPQQQAELGLWVILQKQLPDFTLKASFATAGHPLGLLGASGSGKSMTLRCIAGLETPSQGRIVLNGRVLFDSQRGINLPSRKRRIGFVFQNYALFPHLTVAQNIAFGLQDLSQAERIRRVACYLSMMQLTDLANRYPHQLSGGQQQRVALARALAIHPDALLLDEPLSALDTYLRSQIEKLLTEVLSTYAGVTLFITHKLEEAYRLCRNLLVLSKGNVIANGPKEDIFERPATFTVALVTECKNFSLAQVVDSQHIRALDWDCTLRVVEPIPNPVTHVGIRAHHFTFPASPQPENTFPCWLAMTSETQHRVTLYIKLHGPPTSPQEYHLQAEVYKEKWARIKDRPFPWYICLDPLRLMLMTD